ncbi:MarR family winged helix-turn-helix transcriptional regulator [Cytobacillus sp. Hm23]
MDDYLNHVGFNLKVVARTLTNIQNNKLEQHGVTIAQYRVLYHLKEKEGLSQSELLDALQIKPSSLTGLIEQLENKELVTRKCDSKDGRLKRLYLTNHGSEKIEQLWNIIVDLENDLTSGFSPEEKALLVSWLKKLKKNTCKEANE